MIESDVYDLRREVVFTGISFNSYTIGTSDCNTFIPYYAMYSHTLLNMDGTFVIEYKFPAKPRDYNYTRNYADLFSLLKTTTQPMNYIFKIGDEVHKVYIFKGMLYDSNGKILLCLTIDTEYLMSTDIDIILSDPDNNKLKLIVSNELEDNPKYKNLKKKISTELLSKFRELKIDIILTDNVNNLVFKNNYVVPDFASIEESLAYTNEELPKLMLI